MGLQDFQSQFGSRLALLSGLYLLLFGAANWVWLKTSGVEMTPFYTIVCLLPAVLGVGLAFTSRDDEEQYRLRLLACALMTPILLLFWSTSVDPTFDLSPPTPPHAVWPFAVGASVIHAAAFVGLIFWGGTASTRVLAQTATTPEHQETVIARLLSLDGVSQSFTVGRDGERSILVNMPIAEGRRLNVQLTFDAAKHQVTVIERLAMDGARPIDSSEASMRSIGDPAFDPARPNTQRISGRVAQTRSIEAPMLEAMPTFFRGSHVELPAEFAKSIAESIDEKRLVTLLCAVVTRSGWDWQPVFFRDTKD